MRSVYSILLINLFVAPPLFAQQLIELDVDGVLGNGPDTAYVSTGGSVFIDVWYVGGDPLYEVTPVVCFGALLSYQHSQYIQASGYPAWFGDPPTFPEENCVGFRFVGGTSMERPQPLHAVRLQLGAGDSQGTAAITVDEESSGYVSVFGAGLVDGSIPAYAVIGTTETSESTWGQIKGLFH